MVLMTLSILKYCRTQETVAFFQKLQNKIVIIGCSTNLVPIAIQWTICLLHSIDEIKKKHRASFVSIIISTLIHLSVTYQPISRVCCNLVPHKYDNVWCLGHLAGKFSIRKFSNLVWQEICYAPMR